MRGNERILAKAGCFKRERVLNLFDISNRKGSFSRLIILIVRISGNEIIIIGVPSLWFPAGNRAAKK